MEVKDFFDFELQNSITYDSANLSAVDLNAPLPFLDWVKYFAGLKADPTFLLNQYQQYVNKWFLVNKVSVVDTQDLIQDLYTSLFRNIAVNFFTSEERRFVSNAKLTSPQDVAAIMPLFVKKIRDICVYFSTVRDQVRFSTYDHNLKGSNYSIERSVLDEISNSFIDPTLAKLYAEEGITQSTIRNRIVVDVQELYDVSTNYYDVNSILPASTYNTTGDQTSYFAANSIPFDTTVFVDFNKSVVEEIKKYPVIIQELGTNFSVDLEFTADDLSYLKDSDFKKLTNTLDKEDLSLHTLKQALQTFSGTTFYYLSTNSTAAFTFGKLFEADTYKNYLNRRFPTTAIVPGTAVKSEAEVGKFFKPDKRGILNFVSFEIDGSLSTLNPDQLYVFPDPNKYGNISGLSKTTFDSPFTYHDNVSKLRDNSPLSFRFGAALTDFVVKYRGYQSRSESLDLSPTGISKTIDSTEFFTGQRKQKWANGDVFAQTPSNYQPIDQRQATLQVRNDQTLVQSRSDIYGNEFALFKQIRRTLNPVQVRADALGLPEYCEVYDGGYFYSSGLYSASAYSGFTFDTILLASYNAISITTYSELSTSPSLAATFSGGIVIGDILTQYEYLSATTFNATFSSRFDSGTPTFTYYVPSIKFYPESNFYRTYPTYKVVLYDALEFVSPTIYKSTTFDFGLSSTSGFNQPRATEIADCGPLSLRGKDPSPIVIPRIYTVNNTFVNLTLSGSQTQLAATQGTLSADIGLYHEDIITGDWVFRSYDNTTIIPVSAALSGIFVKYNTDVKSELNGAIRWFDLVYNTLIIETPHYIVFDTLSYDYERSRYSGLPTSTNYLSNYGDSNYTFFSNIWFDETQKQILIAKTTLLSAYSATNYKEVYFDLYKYNFEKLTKVWPTSAVSFSSLRDFSLSATSLSGINFSSIEKPVLSYGRDTGKYTLKYLAKDTSNMFYDVVIAFKLSNELYDLTIDVFKPDMFLHSENFGNGAFSDMLYVGTLAPGASSSLAIVNDVLVFN